MKEQTSKILCDLVLKMYYSEEDAKKANKVELAQMYAEWREKVTQAIRAEQPATNYKFDVWKFVAKDKIRPVMEGIWHEDGFKVASECHCLCWFKESYPENYEKRVVLKDGSFCEYSNYPKWRSVIPTKNEIVHKVDFDAFEKVMADYKTIKKTGDGKLPTMVKCGNAYFKTEFFKKMVDFMRSFGLTEVMLNEDGRRACMVGNPENFGCLLMPIMIDSDKMTPDEVAGIPEV